MRTSLYSILCIVVRLGAILLFVNTIEAFPFAWTNGSNAVFGPDAHNMLVGFSGALLVMSITLWIYPGLLAGMAAGASTRETFESPIAPREIQVIAFAVLGIWFAMNGLMNLVVWAIRLALELSRKDPALAMQIDHDWVGLIGQLLKCAAGIGLAFGARGLAGLLHHIREHGLVEPSRDIAADEPDQS